MEISHRMGRPWIPAFAGMTREKKVVFLSLRGAQRRGNLKLRLLRGVYTERSEVLAMANKKKHSLDRLCFSGEAGLWLLVCSKERKEIIV